MKERLETLVAEMIARGIRFEDAVAEFEKHFILQTLALNRDNTSKTAQALGIHRNTLSKRLEHFRKPAEVAVEIMPERLAQRARRR